MNKIILLILLTYIACATNENSKHCQFKTENGTTNGTDSKLACLKRTYDVEDFEDYRCCWITYDKGSQKVAKCDILRFKESKIDEYRDDLKDEEKAKNVKILCSSSYLLASFVMSYVLLMF